MRRNSDVPRYKTKMHQLKKLLFIVLGLAVIIVCAVSFLKEIAENDQKRLEDSDKNSSEYHLENAESIGGENGIDEESGINESSDVEATNIVTKEQRFQMYQEAAASQSDHIVTGILLCRRASGDGLEIEVESEENNTYSAPNDFPVYLESMNSFGEMSDIPLGYGVTDFLLEEGQIVFAYVYPITEIPGEIRVAIRTNNFEQYYHEKVQLSSPNGMQILDCAGNVLKDDVTDISFDQESQMPEDRKRIVFRGKDGNKISVSQLERNQGVPSYEGCIEVEKTKNGYVLVNVLPLEDYLKYVLPSEMPSSYPKEALKAQAVCARTYAYQHIRRAGAYQYGAHLDDSASYQVYNNLQQTQETNQAISETKDLILARNGEAVTTYFYSTSCGLGTDLRAWNGQDVVSEEDAYIQARVITNSSLTNMDNCSSALNEAENEIETYDGLFSYNDFEAFISNGQYSSDDISDSTSESDMAEDTSIEASHNRLKENSYYENNETYYRWRYETEFDQKLFWTNLRKRYKAEPDHVLTLQQDTYISKPLPLKFRQEDIRNVSIVKRGVGGVATELLIETKNNSYKVTSEKNVRYMLAGENSVLELGENYQKEGKINGMLPSAFLVLQPKLEGDELKSYKVYGGGFGHGIGMSQNGAKCMAKNGLSYKDILSFFYLDTALTELSNMAYK